MKLVKFFPALKHMNIPNVMTTFGMVFGIFAAYYLTQRDLRMAIICLFFAGVMDLMDGYVAAKLKQQTEFGQYLDTLVDFFTCCIIPIWMVYDILGNNPFIVAALILYCICGLWRLAYYNIIEAKKYFTGLPVPGAMSLVTVSIWLVYTYNLPQAVAGLTLFAAGILMVSGINLKKYGPWQIIFAVAGLLFLLLVIFHDKIV
ncbi:MAG: CDP-alcohol phosphatidyltransferase family protein [Defluviitaleaceae bacterium]|nr:CDP-alcohol phosphatidyltransferase family protein [Defluviitaleaceae bacterium]